LESGTVDIISQDDILKYTIIRALSDNRLFSTGKLMNKSEKPIIETISPGAGVEGGKVYLECPGYDPAIFSETSLKFNGAYARASTVAAGLISAPVPPEASSGPVVINVGGVDSNGVYLEVAYKLATNLHPVTNPAIDAEGNIYATLSGMRGQKVPVSVFKICGEGSITPFVSDIINPTGIAINRDGEVFISNRHEGTVHKVSAMGNHMTFASGLGVCTGLVFDREENLYVGDREVAIYRVDTRGEKELFTRLPPSVAAYHMAFGKDGFLYVTGPTLSGYDHVYRIDGSGEADIFFSGLGRPQGFAFDSDGNLHLVCYYRGKGGIIKITPQGEAVHEIAGINLVGLAFDGLGNMIVTSMSSVYRLKLGIDGLPLL
jgi:streptogramin lyase